jgi:hypothetical protein
MLGFKEKKAEVLEHWIAFADNFQAASADFYDKIEAELAAKKVPGLENSRIEFAEGGLLSDKRVYLRIIRERLVFDVCVAPFGTGTFYSCRFAEIPRLIQLWELVFLGCILLIFCPLILLFALRNLGLFLGPLCILILGVMAFWSMRSLVAWGLHDVDRTLIRTPVIGPLYEGFVRKETYYRVDTRLMYLLVVEGIVRSLAEEATAAQGVKLLRQYELAPILGDLYKRVKRDAELPDPATANAVAA